MLSSPRCFGDLRIFDRKRTIVRESLPILAPSDPTTLPQGDQTNTQLAAVTRDTDSRFATAPLGSISRRTTVTGDIGSRRTTAPREAGSRRATVSGNTDSWRANSSLDIHRGPTGVSDSTDLQCKPTVGTNDIAGIHQLELHREHVCSTIEWAQKAYEPIIQIKMGHLPDRYEEPTCALDLAVQSLCIAEVERVLSGEEGDPDGDLRTGLTNTPPLIRAALLGSYEIVDILIRVGASMNYSPKQFPCSPIGAAIIGGNLAIVNRLLTAGADPNAVSYGETALQSAVGVGRVEILDRLLEAGADVNYKIISGRTV